MNDDKIFCGSGKEITTQYGPLMKLSFTKEDLDKLQAGLKNGWVNAALKAVKEPKEGKQTHYVELDTWEPTPQGASARETGDDLPF